MVKKKINNSDFLYSKNLQKIYDLEYEDFLNNFEKDIEFSFSILYSEIDDNNKKKKKNLINQQRLLFDQYKNKLKNFKIIQNDFKMALDLNYLLNIKPSLKDNNYTLKKKKKNNNFTLKNNKIPIKFYNIFYSNNFSNKMKNFINQISDKQYNLGVYNAGGNGDCLFHSIASGIQEAFVSPYISQNRLYTAQELRNIVKINILNWDQHIFNDNISIFKAMELSGDWDDLWLPSQIKNQNDLANQFSKMGNNHWGTDFDLDIISDKLNIGFIIFKSEPNKAEIYSTFKGEKNITAIKKYYMFIYNINDYHYKLAGLREKGSDSFNCIFKYNNIPSFIKKEYYSKCKREII